MNRALRFMLLGLTVVVAGCGRDTKTVPEDTFVVMGDNRSHSCDSRVFGAIPRANITGKVTKIERAG